MRKRILWLLTTVILCGTTAVALCSCIDNSDNPAATTPIGDKIVGKWYAETPKQVTLGTGENAVECAKVVLVGTFDADGEGFWSYILVDKQNRAIQPVGKDGKEHPYYANCNYSVTGNAVDVKLTANYLPTSQIEWTFNYNGTCLQTKYEDRIIDLHPITTSEDAMYQEWMQQLGFGASADNYNINDKDITAQNWRQTEAIYIYDGVGKDVTDEKGRTGYTTVNLPWYEGTKQTNLPSDFCKDMTPDNGWEWVANYCGNRSIVNNNFFAVYNKYTGILRFFYYQPEGFDTGNDHVWQVSMTDNLATHTTIPYGVPNDCTLKDKAAINQTGSGTFMDYIAPWADYKSQDGLIVPNAGWWAFDVDLSMTRPEELSGDNNIKLQMRSWNTNHNSLYSTMSANIDGTMRGSFEAQTTGSISMVTNAKGIMGMLGQLGGPAGDVVSAYMSGNYKSALSNAATLASGAYNVASGKPLKNPGAEGSVNLHTVGTYEGIINLLMKGNINTDGVIKGSQPTVGIASPTLYLKDFDTKNSHVGQGVWNLKKTPMVYALSSQNNVDYWTENKDENIYAGNWQFFDPSSVEVELNPNVFPEDEIEWMQVDAVAIARKEMNWKGTDPFRQAIGLKTIDNTKYKVSSEGYEYGMSHEYNKDINDYVFNFVGAGDFDGQTLEGMSFPVQLDSVKTGAKSRHNYEQELHVFGCGVEDYIIEPQITCSNGAPTLCVDGETGKAWNWSIGMDDIPQYFPTVEINVTVQVKLKSVEAPIVLSRVYLPDYQFHEVLAVFGSLTSEGKQYLDEIHDRIQAKKNLSPKTAGHTQSYDFQAARINKCFNLLFGYSR